jgi:hypothetical protein
MSRDAGSSPLPPGGEGLGVRGLFLVLAAGMSLAAGCGKGPGAEGPPTATAAIATTSEQLARDYETDRAAADGKYKDRWLVVEGPLEDATLFPAGRVLAHVAGLAADPKTKAPGLGVRCEFVPAAGARVADLTKGQTLKCKGRCAGARHVGFVDLTECELLEVGPDPTLAVSAVRLTEEYARDEKAADARYRGKYLLVEGAVRELREMDDVFAVLLEGFDEKGAFPLRVAVVCPAERQEEFAHLKKGTEVKIKGECRGNFLGEVIVGSARLVP